MLAFTGQELHAIRVIAMKANTAESFANASVIKDLFRVKNPLSNNGD